VVSWYAELAALRESAVSELFIDATGAQPLITAQADATCGVAIGRRPAGTARSLEALLRSVTGAVDADAAGDSLSVPDAASATCRVPAL
jgi:hypothetical protein